MKRNARGYFFKGHQITRCGLSWYVDRSANWPFDGGFSGHWAPSLDVAKSIVTRLVSDDSEVAP